MLLNLIKVVVKNILHQATEEWAEELGLPGEEVSRLRERRVGLAVEALSAEVEQYRPFQINAASAFTESGVNRSLTVAALAGDHNGLPSNSEAVDVAIDEPAPQTQSTPSPANQESQESDDQFWLWVDGQRQQQVTWSALAEAATERGRDLSENALRLRYRRWKEQSSASNHN